MASIETDVLVIGAGPAGSAAARTAALRGHRVVLVDRQAFPRDKVCGDALTADALAALQRLGIRDRILARAAVPAALHLHAPGGACVALEADLACLPRRELDALLLSAAIDSGARFIAPAELVRARTPAGAIEGAVFTPRAARPASIAAPRTSGAPSANASIEIAAAVTILATGAAVRPLQVFGVCERKAPSAMAARLYIEAPEALAARHRALCISYDRRICPGYGWVFPLPGNRFNIGAGYFNDARSRPPTDNLRELLARFVDGFEPARALLAGSRALGDVRGAPLRTGLGGAALARPGLLVAGEAAGLTYAFSGEGIGKALQSGLLAGELASDALAAARFDAPALARCYGLSLAARFGARFRAYRRAQDWLEHPRVLDFFAHRANSGRYVRAQLQGLLQETTDPAALFSVRGVIRSLLQ